MSVSSVTPNEDFTEWTVTSEVIDAETSEDGPISYAITNYTDAAGNLGSSDGLLVDSKLEDITIDTKSPEITSPVPDQEQHIDNFWTLVTTIHVHSQRIRLSLKLHRMNRSTRYQQQMSQ